VEAELVCILVVCAPVLSAVFSTRLSEFIATSQVVV